jgi:aminomethyltransferase
MWALVRAPTDSPSVSMPEKTPFYNKHVESNGKITSFAGFLMPVQYRSVIEEVKRVRTTVGIFDVSHMGRVEVSGARAIDFVSKVTVNDPYKLDDFKAQYSAMCYPDGGIVDDLVVYKLPDKFLLVINGANSAKDYDWMLSNKIEGVDINDVGDEMAQLAVQGPKAEPLMQKIVDINLEEIGFYKSAMGKVAGIDSLISRTGYTGEDGFEIYFEATHAEKVWDAVMDAGKEFDVEPAGLGARDTLRLEMKYCLYGNDIDETTTPLEAGLGWITKLEKEDFIGKDALAKQKAAGVKRNLVAFEMMEKVFPRHNYKVFKDDKEIGRVTSGNFSPSINKFIGLGYVDIPFNKIDTEIAIEYRDKMAKAIIVKPPFYKHGTRK